MEGKGPPPAAAACGKVCVWCTAPTPHGSCRACQPRPASQPRSVGGVAGPAGERDHITNVVQARGKQDEALKAQAKACGTAQERGKRPWAGWAGLVPGAAVAVGWAGGQAVCCNEAGVGSPRLG